MPAREGLALLVAAPVALGLCYLGRLRAATKRAKEKSGALVVPKRNPGWFVLERFFAEYEFVAVRRRLVSTHRPLGRTVSALSLYLLCDCANP